MKIHIGPFLPKYSDRYLVEMWVSRKGKPPVIFKAPEGANDLPGDAQASLPFYSVYILVQTTATPLGIM